MDFLIDQGLNPKIPACRNRNDGGPLTTKEANESRLVGKCRFIIEKRIGDLKKFNALYDRRNTEVGHIQIDYRIACAMLNFLHRPCRADQKRDTMKIARNLKEKSKIDSNALTKLFKLQFDSLALPLQNLSEFIDFPSLSEQEMIENIFLGIFCLKQTKSYLADLQKVGKASYVSDDLCSKFQYTKFSSNSKIIGFELPSRHSRGKKKTSSDRYIQTFRDHYKIFVEYIPGLNSYVSVTGMFVFFSKFEIFLNLKYIINNVILVLC